MDEATTARIERGRGRVEAARRIADRAARAADDAARRLAAAAAAGEIVAAAAAATEDEARAVFARVATAALEAVFPEAGYVVEIRTTPRADGRVGASVVLVRDGRDYDPTGDVGGGVTDVVAFGLRLAALVLHDPPVPRVLLLDEPFRFVSRDRRAAVAAMIQALASEFAVQVVQVTHAPELAVGVVVRVEEGSVE